MKKILYTAFLVFGVALTSFSQETLTVALSEGNKELLSSKVDGEYSFTLPNSVTEEQVNKAAGYYTSYFTVGFDNGSKKVNIKMVENSEKTRYIMMRFLSACSVKTMKVDDKEMPLYEFAEEYFK